MLIPIAIRGGFDKKKLPPQMWEQKGDYIVKELSKIFLICISRFAHKQ